MSEFEKWYTDDVDRDDGLFGPGICSCGNEGYHLECQEKQNEFRKEREFIVSLVSELNYQPVDYRSNSLLDEAEKAILEDLDFDPTDNGYSKQNVLENENAFYFPIGWIGCSGHLVKKDTMEIISFGSYIGPEEHIWAYHQGISLANLGKDRKNDLIITEIFNKDETIKVLKKFFDNRYLNKEIVPKLSNLPITLTDLDLYFGIRDLLSAKYKNWFSFYIE
ncbi:hypothetical protein ACG1BZ_09220 [Microbulbifer sp. CNSA002]|uniref:hypothetical protein n=1 Tax=unclassified Microbulbifer TaxID=2619833 RepID=UPI0039B64477